MPSDKNRHLRIKILDRCFSDLEREYSESDLVAECGIARATFYRDLGYIREVYGKDIFDAAKANDAVALDILEKVYNDLAEFLADVCCVLDPEAVVIGGGVSKAGTMLLEGIRKHLHKYIFHAIAPVEFKLATLGNDAGAYGAFKLILN